MDLKIGHYRPIYLWAGPGTIRMNRLKFMRQPVNERAHYFAHSKSGAIIVTERMYCNWVHLTYNWGFPPEIESEDWLDFQKATTVYHQLGSPVFAYIQTSNCVNTGSYKNKNWYALRPDGSKVYYYTGRYMVCLRNREWVAHLKKTVQRALENGADGIFFDNLWHGSMPMSLFNTWLGQAGCHCPDCLEAYRKDTGETIPEIINPADSRSQHYLKWRADQVTELIEELSHTCRKFKPDVLISANDYDPIMRDTYLIFGQNLAQLSRIQDVVMIENFALPKWEPEPKPKLTNNAITIRNALAIIDRNAHLSVLSYDTGIGFDSVYQPRRYLQAIAEAAACGASMTIKGTEYFHQGEHTLLTEEQFAPIQKAIGQYHRWLAANSEIYTKRNNRAPIGLLYPGDELWLSWHALARWYHGLASLLTAEGYPWKVVSDPSHLEGLEILFTFNNQHWVEPHIQEGTRIIHLPDLAGWELASPSWLSQRETLQSVVGKSAQSLMNAYFASRFTRRLFDWMGLARIITQSPYFYLPEPHKTQPVLEILSTTPLPRVQSKEPVLIEVWESERDTQIHLVNYASQSQEIKVHTPFDAGGFVLSPDNREKRKILSGNGFLQQIDIYNILIFKKQNTTGH